MKAVFYSRSAYFAAGSAVHLAAELFNVMAGVNIVRVPYKGSGPVIKDAGIREQ